ncbi:MAG: hypothetical protein WC422_04450 [Candidatus Paceibacterota bacterium]|jgi:hypothetical protein
MIYIIVVIVFLYIIDIILHLKVYGKKREEPEEVKEVENEVENEYTCFICQKKFLSCINYNKNRALCGEDCKRLYLKGGFK